MKEVKTAQHSLPLIDSMLKRQRHELSYYADENDESDSDSDYVEDDGSSESSVLCDESHYNVNPWAVSQEFSANIYDSGHRFPAYMTYQELYDNINFKHQMEGGGEQ